MAQQIQLLEKLCSLVSEINEKLNRHATGEVQSADTKNDIELLISKGFEYASQRLDIEMFNSVIKLQKIAFGDFYGGRGRT